MSGGLLILGLGNPGERYRGTRHNVGFALVDRLAERFGLVPRRPLFRKFELAGGPILLCKPLTYMNRSGDVIPYLLRRFDPETICPVVDNMDLPPGEVRMKTRGTSSNHNGLKSVERALGGVDFPRIYIGIGRPAKGVDVIEHVLGTPAAEDAPAIDDAIRRLVEVLAENADRTAEQLATAINARRRPDHDERS